LAGDRGRLDLLCDAFLSDRHELRSRILARMRQDGIPVEDIIDVVLPEVARSAGQRWMDDDISFADVTIVTARLQETVRALGRVPRGAYPARLEDKVETAQARPRVLLIIPRTEEHTMGAFVVADQIRRNGCEVDIAMDVHARQVAEMVRKTRYHMVGITAAGRRSLASAKELVDTIRASVTRVTPIVLGGSVVEGVASLKAMTGVDYVVCDASAALKACGLLERTELRRMRRHKTAAWAGRVTREPDMNTRGSDFWDQPSAPQIGPEQFSEIVTTAADLAIVLDTEGTVKSVITNPLNPTLGRLDHWKDRDIREFMADDSLAKLETQLDRVSRGPEGQGRLDRGQSFRQRELGIPDPLHDPQDRQSRHHPDAGRDLRPIAELQHRLVKAQLALEKDYETHRDYETRYRVVLEATRDAFALVDVATGRDLDINTAAARLLGDDPDALAGSAFAQEFDGRRRGEFIEGLVLAAADEAMGQVTAQARRSKTDVSIEPIVFRAAGDKVLLCRIEASETAETVLRTCRKTLSQLYRDGPDAMVFTDANGDDPLRQRGVPEPRRMPVNSSM
jgi:methanogenic corrinoid protein MtbC1